MLRLTSRCLQAQQQQMNSQQPILQIDSAYGLLRMCHRSIDIHVKSRQARNFLKRRLMDQWRNHCKEQDPEKQRFLMDHAASFLQVLHMPKHPDPSQIVVFQLSRVKAHQMMLEEEAKKLAAKPAVKKDRV